VVGGEAGMGRTNWVKKAVTKNNVSRGDWNLRKKITKSITTLYTAEVSHETAPFDVCRWGCFRFFFLKVLYLVARAVKAFP
jgi:hypothetical protein